jgi:3-oxoacyl-[acyl-carrier protein] reductase
MEEAGGSRITSVSARAASVKEMRTAYSAAKAGQLGFTGTWSLELGRHNITVNTVAPEPIGVDLFYPPMPMARRSSRKVRR